MTDCIRRLVDSFSADFVYGVSGELTSKRYLIAHGLHCITGKKEAVQIMNEFEFIRINRLTTSTQIQTNKNQNCYIFKI